MTRAAARVPVEPPYIVQQRASDAAFMLCEEFPGRLTLEQRVAMEVTRRYAPERLGWREVGSAISLWAMVVEVRV
jgi:hypothetical protein